MQSHKTCTKCGEEKPLSSFHLRSTRTQLRVSRCKECKRAYRSQYYDKNTENEKGRIAEWQKVNRDRHNEYNKKWRLENLAKAQEQARYSNYKYRQDHPGYVAGSGAKRDRERQELTEFLAINAGNPWEPSDDAFLLADNDSSLYQKAIHLGRTYASVKIRSQRIRRGRPHAVA